MGLRRELGRLAGGIRNPVEGWLRMLVAAADDVVKLPAGGEDGDPLDLRDPEYIRRTLPALRVAYRFYHRAEVEGLEHVPSDGPVLLVGNHSGGTVIVDTFILAHAFYEHFGPDRTFHQLAHDLVFKVPGARALVQRYGTVPASPENMAKALDRDAALLVYPGGDHETYRPTWQQDRIDFAGRAGFVKLALEHDVPIVPVVAIGGQETALFLGRGRRLARGLKLDKLLRLKVLPPVLGPPFGVTVLDLPGRLPLPAKVSIRVLEPLHLRERLGDDPDIEAAYELVTGEMQAALTELAEARTLPVVG